MELEHFIEQDMGGFLDQRRSQDTAPATDTPRHGGVLSPEELAIYSPGRDFTKELQQVLKDGDLSKAKHVLQELKESYSSYPEDAPERLEGNRLLKSLYATFQKARERQTQEESMTPEPYSSMPPQKALSPSLSSDQPKGLSEDEEHALLADITHIETLMDEQAYISAISHYQDLKRKLQMEELTSDQRKRFIPKLQEMYAKLHEMLDATPQTESQAPQDLQTPFSWSEEKHAEEKKKIGRADPHLSQGTLVEREEKRLVGAP